MNPFVNPNKRSVLLPNGCKDLVDVLRLSKTEKETGGSIPIIRPEAAVGRLEQVNHYVAKLLASAAHTSVLGIGSLDGYTRVVLEREARGLTIYPMMGTGETENHVEEFFESHVIQPCVDMQAGKPGMTTRVLGFALPLDRSKVTALMIDLLHSVFGFDTEAELEFTYVDQPWPE